jgi:hypothetical protein
MAAGRPPALMAQLRDEHEWLVATTNEVFGAEEK